MARRFLIWTALIGLAAVACSRNTTGPTSHEPSLMLVSIQQETAAVVIFDADVDTILDSIRIPDWSNAQMAVDPVGRRLILSYGYDVRLYDLGQNQPYRTLNIQPSFEFALSHSPDLIIGSGGPMAGVGSQHIAFYDPADFSVVFADSIELSDLQVDEKHGLVYGHRVWSHGTQTDRYQLYAYDLVNRRLYRRWEVYVPGIFSGTIVGFQVHPDGRRLYMTSNTYQRSELIGYDLEREKLIFRRVLHTSWGRPCLTPDGKQLWYPDPGFCEGGPVPETISIYDAENGTLISEIWLGLLRPPTATRFQPVKIRFTPSGDKAYVLESSSAFCGPSGPLLVIDVKTRSVIKSFWPERRWTGDLGSMP